MKTPNHTNLPHTSENPAAPAPSRGTTRNVVRIVIAAITLTSLIAAIWRPAGDALMLLAANAVRLPAGALLLLVLELIATNLPIIAGAGILIAVIVINGIRLRRKPASRMPHHGHGAAAPLAATGAH